MLAMLTWLPICMLFLTLIGGFMLIFHGGVAFSFLGILLIASGAYLNVRFFRWSEKQQKQIKQRLMANAELEANKLVGMSGIYYLYPQVYQFIIFSLFFCVGLMFLWAGWSISSQKGYFLGACLFLAGIVISASFATICYVNFPGNPLISVGRDGIKHKLHGVIRWKDVVPIEIVELPLGRFELWLEVSSSEVREALQFKKFLSKGWDDPERLVRFMFRSNTFQAYLLFKTIHAYQKQQIAKS